jgi:hypothetical protein
MTSYPVFSTGPAKGSISEEERGYITYPDVWGLMDVPFKLGAQLKVPAMFKPAWLEETLASTRGPRAWKGIEIYPPLVTDDRSIVLTFGERAPEEEEQSDPPAEIPLWISDALVGIFSYLSLPVNWDSYGGLPLDQRHARTAWRFLERFMAHDTPLPDFVPLADGGIQLEWQVDGDLLSFTVEDDAPPAVWVSTSTESREVPWVEVPAVMEEFRRRMG